MCLDLQLITDECNPPNLLNDYIISVTTELMSKSMELMVEALNNMLSTNYELGSDELNQLFSDDITINLNEIDGGRTFYHKGHAFYHYNIVAENPNNERFDSFSPMQINLIYSSDYLNY